MLDMGEPVKILDLANALIRSRGLRPGKDIEIVFTGARQGERLAEDLLGTGEGWRATAHASIRQVVTPIPERVGALAWTLNNFLELARSQTSTGPVRALPHSIRTRAPPSPTH